jgi:hypothetical protein
VKASRIRGVVTAILMLVAGAGLGIAQAAGNRVNRPVLSFEDQEALGRGSSSSLYAENRPVLNFDDDVQLGYPLETGTVPAKSDADSITVEIGGISYYSFDGKLYGVP